MNLSSEDQLQEQQREKASLAQAELARVLARKLFRKSQVLQRLLAFLVEAELLGQTVTEILLATSVFGLAEAEFHPYTNAHVRVNTSLLRRRLVAYYHEAASAKVRFHLPQGSFRLRIDVLNLSQERWRRAYAQARLLSTSWYVDELELALQRIAAVVAEQPGFAPAYALRSQIHMTIGSHGGPPREQAAREAAERAMELAPDSWESLTAAGNVAGLFDWDWTRAELLYGRAEAIPGNEVVADPWYQAAQVAIDRIDPCLTKMRQALWEYPLPPRGLQKVYGAMLYLARRWDEAEAEMTQTTQLYPDDFVAWYWLGMQAMALGNRAKAIHCMARSIAVTRGRLPGALLQVAQDFLTSGKLPVTRDIPGSASECVKFFVGAVTRRPEPAIDALERAMEAGNVLAAVYLRAPMQDYLHDSPRYLALFDRMGIPRPRKS